MSVVESVERDLAAMDKRREGVSTSAVAAVALELAKQLDSTDNSATSKSMCAKELREQLAALEARLPPVKDKNPVDELRARRSARRRASAA